MNAGLLNVMASQPLRTRLKNFVRVTFDASAGNVKMPPGATAYVTKSGPSITHNHVITLPPASSYVAGQRVIIADAGANLDDSLGTLEVVTASGNFFDVTASYIIYRPLGYIELVSDGVATWNFLSGSIDVIDALSPIKLEQSLTLNAGSTAPNQGTVWSGIAGTELVTAAAVEAEIERRYLFASNASNVTVLNNSTTLTNVTGLSLTLEAGKTYEVEALVSYASASNSAGNKFALAYTGTASSGIDGVYYRNNVGDLASFAVALLGTYSSVTSQAANASLMFKTTLKTTTSGTLTFKSAQVSAEVSDHIVRANSSLSARTAA